MDGALAVASENSAGASGEAALSALGFERHLAGAGLILGVAAFGWHDSRFRPRLRQSDF